MDNLHHLLSQAIAQAISDLTAARTRLDANAYAHLGHAGILRNGQRVDLHAARLTDAWTHLTATVAIAARVLNLIPEPSRHTPAGG